MFSDAVVDGWLLAFAMHQLLFILSSFHHQTSSLLVLIWSGSKKKQSRWKILSSFTVLLYLSYLSLCNCFKLFLQVSDRAELLYTEVCNAVNEISDKFSRSGLLESNTKACGLRKHIMELERMLRKEKEEFEVLPATHYSTI